MNNTELTNAVETMVEKAGKAEKSEDAMRFSQAACNAANTISVLKRLEQEQKAYEANE